MNEFQVTCITQSSAQSGHEHITHIGGKGASDWRLTKEAVIARIEAKPQTEAFYTLDRSTGNRVYIGVVRGDGNKAAYLRTYADGKWNDNLLALPQCPASHSVIG